MSQGTRQRLVFGAIVAVAIVGLLYQGFAGRGGPALPAPSTDAPPALDCSGFNGDPADCKAMEEAAAKLLHPETGSRAVVTTVPPGDMAHVEYLSTDGVVRSAADVIPTPVGGYGAVNPSYAP